MNPLDVLRLQYLQDLENDEDSDYKIASISNDSINNTLDIADKSDQVSIGKKQINRSLTKLLLPFPVSYPKKMPRKLVDSREISESTLLESSQIVNMVSIETGKIQVGSKNQKEKNDSSSYESLETMKEFLVKTDADKDSDFKKSLSRTVNKESLIQQSEDDVQRDNNLGQLETMQEFLSKSQVREIEPMVDKQKLAVKSVKNDQGHSRSKSHQQKQKEDQDLIIPAETEPNESLETMQEFLSKTDTSAIEPMVDKQKSNTESVKNDQGRSRSKSRQQKEVQNDVIPAETVESLEIIQEFLAKSQANERIKEVHDKRQHKSRQHIENNFKDQDDEPEKRSIQAINETLNEVSRNKSTKLHQNDPLENNFNTNNTSKSMDKKDKGKSISIQQQRDSQNKSEQEPIKKEKIHSRSQSDQCEKLKAADGDTDDSKKTTTRAQRHSRSYSLQPKEEEHNISSHGTITLDNAEAIEITHLNLDSQKDNMLGGETTIKSMKNAVKNEQNLSESHILQKKLLTASSDMYSYLEPSEMTKTTNKHDSKIKTAQKFRDHSASKEQHFNFMDSEEQLELNPTQTLEHYDSDNSYNEAFNRKLIFNNHEDMISKKNDINLSHMPDSFDDQDQLAISNKAGSQYPKKYSNIPETEPNHIKSEIQLENKMLTLQPALPIDHKSKTIQAKKNNITKIKKLKFINSIDSKIYDFKP